MNFVILFLALLWAVAADKDEDKPIPPHPRDLEEGDPIHLVLPPLREDAEQKEPPHLQLRQLQVDGTDVDIFCREIDGELHQLAAPRGITDWLLVRGWVRGTCNGKAKWKSARDHSPFYQTYVFSSFASL